MYNEKENASSFFAIGKFFVEVERRIIPNYPDITSGSFIITIKKLDIIEATFNYNKDTIIDIGNNDFVSIEQCLHTHFSDSVFIKINKRERDSQDIFKFNKMLKANNIRKQKNTPGVEIYLAIILFK